MNDREADRDAFKDWHSRNHDTLTGTELHRIERQGMQKAWIAALAYARQQSAEPVAWERAWSRNGETPKKERNENGRMAWPKRFKFLPVTKAKILPDDFPLYAAPPAVQDSWEETARQYAENAKYWRERYEATQKQAEPVACPFGCTTQEEHDAHDNNTNVTGPHPMLSATG